jgi:N-acetyl-alpha-D-muramate 1-phosphate uridylyltransferase
MTLPVAILAGGLAHRLRPVTESIPKALVEVAGRPFAEHQLEWLRRQGVERAVFLVGYRGEMIREALGEGSRWGLTIEYVFDGPTLLGTGGAIKRALPVLGTPFFVMYGDSYLDCDLADIAGVFRASGAEGLMTVFRNDNRWDASNVQFEEGRIQKYDKRNRTAAMQHIDYGIGVLSAAALDHYAPDAPFDLALVYQDLLARGVLAAYEVTARFYEIGTPQGLEETRAYLASRATGHS